MINPVLDTANPKSFTLHLKSYHSIPYTLGPTPCTLHPTPYTLTLNHKL